MGAISWTLRIILIMLIIRMIVSALQNARAPRGRSNGPAGQPRQRNQRLGGKLVRDPQCGTYVPIERALHVGSGDHAVYFCSEACRNEFQKSQSSVA